MTDCNKKRSLSLIITGILIVFFVVSCDGPGPSIKPTSQYPTVFFDTETAISTVETPIATDTSTSIPTSPPPTSTQSPSPTNPTPTSTPTNTPYNPFLNWSDEPNNEIEIHYDFSRMTKEDVKKFFEVNRYDFTVDSEGLHWIVDGSLPDTINSEFLIWPLRGIKYDIANLNIQKVIIYFSLVKPETYRFYDVKESKTVFPESTFFYHFECKGNSYDVRILSGATTWILAKDTYQNSSWAELESLPKDAKQFSDGLSKTADSDEWSEKYVITVIPFNYDSKDNRFILGETLIRYASSSPIDFSYSYTSEKNILDYFPNDRLTWNGFDCFIPSLKYIGFRSEYESGINATIHDMYIIGEIKNIDN